MWKGIIFPFIKGDSRKVDELNTPMGFFKKIGKKDLKVSSIIQKAKLIVKEKGTEASAATSVTIAVKSAKPDNKVFYANKPFIFFIVDNTTKAILFIGVYTGHE